MQYLHEQVNDSSLEKLSLVASETSTISADEEIRRFPSRWAAKTNDDCSRILFYPKDDKPDAALVIYAHPQLGSLVDPWQLHKRGSGKFIYFKPNTLEEVTIGPRKPPSRRKGVLTKTVSSDELSSEPPTKTPLPPPGSVRIQKIGMWEIIRLPIPDKARSNVYEAFRVIDAGQGVLGGMNSGVYVVHKRISVSFSFRKDISLATRAS